MQFLHFLFANIPDSVQPQDIARFLSKKHKMQIKSQNSLNVKWKMLPNFDAGTEFI
jgi:hypothetical protein